MRMLARAISMAWRPAPVWFVITVALPLGVSLVPLVVAWQTKAVLDAVANPSGGRAAAVTAALWLAGASAAAAAFPPLSRYAQAALGRRVALAAHEELYRAVERLEGLRTLEDPAFHDRLRLAQQASSGPTRVVDHGVGLAAAAMTSTGFAVALVRISPTMTVALLGFAVPTIAAQHWLASRRVATTWLVSPKYRREAFYSQLLTSPDAAKELRVFGSAGFLRRKMMRERQAVNGVEERLDRHVLGVHGALGVLAAGIGAAGLLWAVAQAATGHRTPGDVVLFVAAVGGVQAAIVKATADIAGIHESTLVLRHFLAIRDIRSDLSPAPCAVPGSSGAQAPSLRLGIELHDIWFRYGEDQPWILRGVSLNIPYGHSVALVGPNGSGKSTILKLLCRLYDPTSGQITWDGIDIRRFPVDQLRRRLSAMFQDHMRYELTVAENIGVGDPAALAESERIRAAASRAGIHDAVGRLPREYETMLTRTFTDDDLGAQPGVVLSGGQWQRLALARALVRADADLLILDEPASGLDPEAEVEVQRTLHACAVGRTTIMVSHRLGTVRAADRIVVLAGGVVVEAGTHDELIARGMTYARLFRAQARGYQPSVPATAR